MIYLERGDTFKCPNCGCGWDIESWNTEYNIPTQGVSEVFCSVCNKRFNIDVEVVTIISVVTPPVVE